MGTLHGIGGLLYLQGSGDNATKVGEAKTWRLNVDREAADDTAMGDSWTTQKHGILKWSGNITGNFDTAETSPFDSATANAVKKLYLYTLTPDTNGRHCYYGTIWPKLNVEVDKSGIASFNLDFDGDSAMAGIVPVLDDTFTRANAAIGTAETGGAWTGATWTVASNKAVNTPTLGVELAAGNLTVGTWYSITATQVDYFYAGCAVGDTFRATATTALDANNKVKAITLATLFASLATDPADGIFDVDVVLTAGTQAGLIICLDSAVTPANFILAYHDGTNAHLDKCVAGTYTSLINSAAAYSASATLRVRKSSTSVELWYNGSQVGTTQTVSDTGVISNVIHGLFSSLATSNTLDNFRMQA